MYWKLGLNKKISYCSPIYRFRSRIEQKGILMIKIALIVRFVDAIYLSHFKLNLATFLIEYSKYINPIKSLSHPFR